jgi:hypothetical protein
MRMERRKRSIDKVYKRRDRIDMPDFQREEVWPDNKKRTFIDTILKGWHIPKFYFRKLDDGSFECVDGQQRLSSIFEFFDDNLSLDHDTARRVGATRYSELPDDVSDNFDDYEIDIEEIEDASDFDMEELFQRLQLGTPLNTAEKLNAISGDLRDFCHEASVKPFYTDKIVLRNTRYAHFESMVRWIYIEARGIQPQMRFPQFESFLKENRSFSYQSETAQKILKSLKYLEIAFLDKCRYLRNRANVLSICMLTSRVISSALDKGDPKIFGNFVEDFFKKLATEVEKGGKSRDKELLRYQQAITSDSMGGNSIKARINILTKRLAIFSSNFAPLLGAYQDAGDEATRNISELVSLVKELIYKVNESYSSSHGEDLFKLTNKATASLSKIEVPCRDVNQYGDFIDALYFLIYEGSGACKRLPSPPPDIAMDIKFMRTAIRHDVDHGNKKEIEKKHIRNGYIFEKYSGKKTPGECSSEDFLSTQVRLLNNLSLTIESFI